MNSLGASLPGQGQGRSGLTPSPVGGRAAATPSPTPLGAVQYSLYTTDIDDIDVNLCMYSVSQKIPPPRNFLTFFPKRLSIFSPSFARLLYVPIYAGLQIFIQLPATLTKLCHNKRDHHNVFKMSTIDRNACWVVALNMA